MGEYDFVYVPTDIPEGMTIREWRARRATAREAERAATRARSRARLHRPLVALGRTIGIATASLRATRRTVG